MSKVKCTHCHLDFDESVMIVEEVPPEQSSEKHFSEENFPSQTSTHDFSEENSSAQTTYRYFCCTGIHILIELHGIDTDYLTIVLPGKR